MRRFGKKVGDALYLHRSVLEARRQLWSVSSSTSFCYWLAVRAVQSKFPLAQWTVAKVREKKSIASLLWYPGFDEEPHPALAVAYRVMMHAQGNGATVTCQDYRRSASPPILHRKELMVTPGYPRREAWVMLTAQEEAAGLYDDTSRIGTRAAWEALLAERGLRYDETGAKLLQGGKT